MCQLFATALRHSAQVWIVFKFLHHLSLFNPAGPQAETKFRVKLGHDTNSYHSAIDKASEANKSFNMRHQTMYQELIFLH